MPGSIFRMLTHSLTTLSPVAYDLARVLVVATQSRRAPAAENLVPPTFKVKREFSGFPTGLVRSRKMRRPRYNWRRRMLADLWD